MKKHISIFLAFLLITGTLNVFAFSDVDSSMAQFKAITELSDDGVINGYEDGTFKPGNAITRAEATTIAVRSMNYDVIDAGVSLY